MALCCRSSPTVLRTTVLDQHGRATCAGTGMADSIDMVASLGAVLCPLLDRALQEDWLNLNLKASHMRDLCACSILLLCLSCQLQTFDVARQLAGRPMAVEGMRTCLQDSGP